MPTLTLQKILFVEVATYENYEELIKELSAIFMAKLNPLRTGTDGAVALQGHAAPQSVLLPQCR